MGIFTKGISREAYRGRLTCPAYDRKLKRTCGSSAIRFLENVGPFRLRYRCRRCGFTFQYDISNNPHIHPYAPFNKKTYQDIVAMSKGGQTRR